MGPVNFATYQQIKARVPDAQNFGLPYSAAAITPDLIGKIGGDYGPSLQTGMSMLSRYVNGFISACPHQRLVLLGYSQGAHVVGDMLPLLGANPTIRSHIAGVLLFGDPRFNPHSPIVRGSFSKELKGALPTFDIGTIRTVSSTWWSIARSYCSSQDFVCNFSNSNVGACPEGSSCGHFGYVNSFTAASAGAWAGNMVRGLQPLGPSAPPTPVTSPVVSGGPAYYTYRVYNTGGIGLKIRSAPNTGGSILGVIPEGGAVQIVCQVHGQRVFAETDVWNKTTSGGWVYDEYVSTPNVGSFSIRPC